EDRSKQNALKEGPRKLVLISCFDSPAVASRSPFYPRLINVRMCGCRRPALLSRIKGSKTPILATSGRDEFCERWTNMPAQSVRLGRFRKSNIAGLTRDNAGGTIP